MITHNDPILLWFLLPRKNFLSRLSPFTLVTPHDKRSSTISSITIPDDLDFIHIERKNTSKRTIGSAPIDEEWEDDNEEIDFRLIEQVADVYQLHDSSSNSPGQFLSIVQSPGAAATLSPMTKTQRKKSLILMKARCRGSSEEDYLDTSPNQPSRQASSSPANSSADLMPGFNSMAPPKKPIQQIMSG